jgi:branched-chain amino acid transport system substrate-binding protein
VYRKNWARRAVAGTALLGIALVAACGGADDQGGGKTQGGESTSQGVDEDSIKIGLFGPLSGSAAVFGKGIHSLDALYRTVNDNGGINGRKLELVIEDGKCDPQTTRLAVTKLIQKDKVFMLHGGLCSGAVVASMPIIKQSGIPFLISSAAANGLVDPPTRNVFHGWVNSSSGTAMNAQLLSSFAKETGAKKIGVIGQSDEWGQGWVKSFEKSLAEMNKGADAPLEVVVTAEIPPDVTDATPQVQKLKAAGVDAAAVYAYPDPMSVFLRNAHQQGLSVPVVTGQGTFPEDQVDRLGSLEPVANFFASYCMSAPLTSPELAKYRDAVAKYYPKDTFDLSSMLGLSGFDINEHVLTQMGDDLTWENWIATAEKIKDLETAAAPGPVSFAPFDESDPRTRIGVESCNVSHVDPGKGKDGPVVVLPPEWSEWEKLKQG